MKDFTLPDLIRKLMKEGVLKQETELGARAVFNYHLHKGRIPMRTLDHAKGIKRYMWNEKEYPFIRRSLLDYLRA